MLSRRMALPYWLRGTAMTSLAAAILCQGGQVRAETINDTKTPAQAVDRNNITGIGQVVTDEGGGFLNLCTGTLINPRMVLFAAHCVNTQPATSYGANGTPLAVSFGNDTYAAVREYIYGATKGQTNVGNATYNANQVRYNDLSLALGPDNNFYQADIATATLDTPAGGIPTWALLFSKLPNPDSISASSGTNYHVTSVGYGVFGNGTSGDYGGIDFRRRVVENMLGGLTSLSVFNDYLYGEPDDRLQNLYMIDFDDPTRTNQYDVNVFRDNALPNEGVTASGDSGGPLILDRAFSKSVVIGVLSGGGKIFAEQPFSSYGATSFFQPLYLYWDWIAANNPYHYVGAKAGDGKWSDPDHWVTKLDPAYQVIGPDGKLLNGVPTTPGEGVNGSSGQFGQICIQLGQINQCQDLATGELVDDVPNDASASVKTKVSQGETTPVSDRGNVRLHLSADGTYSVADDVSQAAGARGATSNAAAVTSSADSSSSLPDATLLNGLPGASDFVPNDDDGDAANGVIGRYFDVTLSEAGRTTLDVQAVVDRMTVTGKAALDITAGGSLSSLIDTTQTGGQVNVDGRFVTVGDYALLGGLLTGRGVISTPYLTNAVGVIAPGSLGGVGKLSIEGNLILSSASALAIDVGPNHVSDLLSVSGAASLGGTVVVTPIAGYKPIYGDSFTFLTASGGIGDGFQSATAFSAILYPHLSYSADAAMITVAARPYADVINPGSVNQTAFAQLLDQNRPGNYAALASVYGALDPMPNAQAIQATLEQIAPRGEGNRRAIEVVESENVARFHRDRLAFVRSGAAGGTLQVYGTPARVAQQVASNQQTLQRTDVATDQPVSMPTSLPDTVSAFVAAGYLDADARNPASAIGARRSSINGWYGVAGAEIAMSPATVLGGSISYSDLDGDSAARMSGRLVMGTLYGTHGLPGAFVLSGQASVGGYTSHGRRQFTLGDITYDLRSRESSVAYSAEANVGRTFREKRLAITPNAGLRYHHGNFGAFAEDGDRTDAALRIDQPAYNSLQARAGIDLDGSVPIGRSAFSPHVTAAFVHELKDQPAGFGANFVGGIGPNAQFALPGSDRNWGEVGVGGRLTGRRVHIDVGIDATVGRGDLSARAYHAAVTYRF